MSGFDLDLQPAEIAEIDRRMKKLSDELQVRATRAGLRAAGKPIVQDAQTMAPIDEGHLYDSINQSLLGKAKAAKINLFTGAKKRIQIDNPAIAMIIGPNKKIEGEHQGFKGALLEFGTTPGGRVGKRGRMRGVKYQSKGITADPFLAPAFESNQSGINARFYKGLTRYLNRIDQ